MRNRKYIICSGLAFADQEDMQMLHDYALKGWIFRELRFGIVYVLYKEEPQDLIFSYELRKVKEEEKMEYLAIFEEAGWKPIPKWDKDTHFFYAKNGTVSVHSDVQTQNEQYRPVFITSMMVLVIGILLSIFAFVMQWVYLAPIGGACVGGGGLMVIGCYLRTKGRRLRIDPWTYGYQLFKFIVGLVLLWIFLRIHVELNLYSIVLAAVMLWLTAGSIYGCYRTYLHKRRK